MQEDGRETSSHTDHTEHIDLETLGILAEGKASAPIADQAVRHLAECRSCMAAYADAVRYRSAWISLPGAFTPTTAVLRRARRAKLTPEARRTANVWRWAYAGTVVVVVAGAGSLLWWQGWRPARLPDASVSTLRVALERESAQGFVLPEGERGARLEASPQRSGAVVGRALREAVAEVVQRYEAGDRSARSSYHVAAGFFLTGNLDAARDYLSEGVRAYPSDRSLGVLAAALDYRNSDLDGAERQLREVLRVTPEDEVAMFDLALVLAERGRAEEAHRLLESLVREHPGSSLLDRAREMLAASRR